jgi:hypothetical protein
MIRYLLSLFILLGPSLSAQNFNYTVSTTTETWQELNSQTILNANNRAWNFSYKIPVGFPFTFLGRSFDSLTIERNGYVVFDEDRNYAFTACSNLSDYANNNGAHAVLGYELSGANNNHILKIQFKNLAIGSGDSRKTSYQIWLKENGSIEFHAGPTDFRPHFVCMDTTWSPAVDSMIIDSVFTQIDSTIGWRIGLINQNMNSANNGFFIEGNPDNPFSQQTDAQHEPAFLLAPPKCGTRYTFSPNAN